MHLKTVSFLTFQFSKDKNPDCIRYRLPEHTQRGCEYVLVQFLHNTKGAWPMAAVLTLTLSLEKLFFANQGMSQGTHCSDVYNNEEPEAIQVSIMEKWIILWEGMNHSYNSQHRRMFGSRHWGNNKASCRGFHQICSHIYKAQNCAELNDTFTCMLTKMR